VTPGAAAIWMRSTSFLRWRISRAVFGVTIEKVAPSVPMPVNLISPTTLYVRVGVSVASLIVPPICVFACEADHVSIAISFPFDGMRPSTRWSGVSFGSVMVDETSEGGPAPPISLPERSITIEFPCTRPSA